MKTLTLFTLLLITVAIPPSFAADQPVTWQVGTYEGDWTSVFTPIEIEITSLTGNQAELAYRWGANPAYGIRQPGEDKFSGTIEDRVLRFLRTGSRGKTDFTFTLKDDGTIEGKATGAVTLYGKLKRKK